MEAAATTKTTDETTTDKVAIRNQRRRARAPFEQTQAEAAVETLTTLGAPFDELAATWRKAVKETVVSEKARRELDRVNVNSLRLKDERAMVDAAEAGEPDPGKPNELEFYRQRGEADRRLEAARQAATDAHTALTAALTDAAAELVPELKDERTEALKDLRQAVKDAKAKTANIRRLDKALSAISSAVHRGAVEGFISRRPRANEQMIYDNGADVDTLLDVADAGLKSWKSK